MSESERKMNSTELKKTLEAKTNAVTKLKDLNRTCADCGTPGLWLHFCSFPPLASYLIFRNQFLLNRS
jgi:hypothetical protein